MIKQQTGRRSPDGKQTLNAFNTIIEFIDTKHQNFKINNYNENKNTYISKDNTIL